MVLVAMIGLINSWVIWLRLAGLSDRTDTDGDWYRSDSIIHTMTTTRCFSSLQLTKEMVMEKPSAQLVGREFVRQYYTLLNQAPDYLHR